MTMRNQMELPRQPVAQGRLGAGSNRTDRQERAGDRFRRRPGRETVQVTYYPVLKNQALGRRMTRTITAQRGENPVKAAERALASCYKVRDYVIFDAHIAKPDPGTPGSSTAASALRGLGGFA